MRALTRIEADVIFAQGCANPGCNDPSCEEGLFINQICHPRAPTQTRYSKTDGVITVECAECDQPIVAFRIAEP